LVPQFGTDGIRGVANVDITPEVAFALAQAATDFFGLELYVIGRDTRLSGPMLEAAMVSGFTSAGASVELVGVVPTPAVAWISADRGVPGVMISASHNPFGDNGIKLFAPGGTKLSDDIQTQIQNRMEEYLSEQKMPRPQQEKLGQAVVSSATQRWESSVVASVANQSLSGLNLVIDCANGSASESGKRIFEILGASVEVIANEPDGININSGCGSTYPEMLSKAVVRSGADAGLAFDGDADRLIAIDNEGSIIDGDRVIAILAKDLKANGKLVDDTVVVTVMSNLGFHKAMQASAISVVTTQVGDRYVLEKLNEGNYSLGGEQSGHIICTEHASTGDGILAGVQLLDAVKRSGSSLKDLASQVMNQVPQVLLNVKVKKDPKRILEKIAPEVESLETSFSGQGRILVRASGTEPLIRVMVEHNDEELAHKVAIELEQLVVKHK